MRIPTPFRAGPHRLVPLALFALVWAVWLGGCDKDDVNAPNGPSLESQVWSAVEQSGLLDDDLFPTGEFPLDGAGGASDPVATRRSFTHVDYVQQFVFGDTVMGEPQSAIVKVCDYLKGNLQVVQQYAPQDPTPADSSDRLLDKVYNGDWFRNALVRRDATQPSGWRVVNVSQGLTLVDDHHPCVVCRSNFEQLQLDLPGGPVQLSLNTNLPIDSLIHVTGSGPYTLTARTTHDDDVVLLHDAQGSRRMPRTGPNTYTGALTLGAPGQRTFTVEAFPESVMTVPSYVITQSGWTYTIAVDP